MVLFVEFAFTVNNHFLYRAEMITKLKQVSHLQAGVGTLLANSVCGICFYRSGITNYVAVSLLCQVTWTISEQLSSTMSTLGFSVLLMIKQSEFGTGRAGRVFQFLLATIIMLCVPNFIQLKI